MFRGCMMGNEGLFGSDAAIGEIEEDSSNVAQAGKAVWVGVGEQTQKLAVGKERDVAEVGKMFFGLWWLVGHDGAWAKAMMQAASSLVMGTGAFWASKGAVSRTGCVEPVGRSALDSQREVRGRKQGCVVQ